jgi:hypothetical protein
MIALKPPLNCSFVTKKKNTLTFVGLVMAVVLASFANADQVAFSKAKQPAGLHFSYQWLDSFAQTQNLEFTLPTNQQGKYTHKRFVKNLAQQYVYIELHKAARKIDPREARITIKRRTQNNIKVEVSSRSEQMLKKWQQAMRQSETRAFDNYLLDNYYSRFTSYLGQEAIKPDHLRYITENKRPLLPIAQAIYDTLPVNTESRVYINLLLSWVQSIPYNELEDRMTSNGAGYLPPLGIITHNHGDCDSKSVLMASLIRSLLPDVPMVMIYLPQHALLGISMPVRTNEPTYTFEGIDYLLMEPTGPALSPLGEIGGKSKSDIASGLYSYEHIP